MIYIGKLWFKKPMQTKKIAERLGLEDIIFHRTDDITGIMQWRGGNVLVLLHLSWGDINDTEKIKIFAHHIEDTEGDELFKLIMKMLRDITMEAMPSDDVVYNATKKEISRMEKDK